MSACGLFDSAISSYPVLPTPNTVLSRGCSWRGGTPLQTSPSFPTPNTVLSRGCSWRGGTPLQTSPSFPTPKKVLSRGCYWRDGTPLQTSPSFPTDKPDLVSADQQLKLIDLKLIRQPLQLLGQPGVRIAELVDQYLDLFHVGHQYRLPQVGDPVGR